MANVTHNQRGNTFTSSSWDDDVQRQSSGYGAGSRSVKSGGRLSETMRLIQERAADRSSKVDDHQQRHTLQLLLQDISDVIDDIPKDIGLFDFHVTGGNPPRLWIDKTTFVVMASHREGYRLLKDTKVGRVLVRESYDRKTIGEAVLHYVAERLTQYDQEHHPASASQFHNHENSQFTQTHGQASTAKAFPASQTVGKRSPWRSFFWFIAGLLSGAALLFCYAWFRLEINAYVEKILSFF